MYTLNHRKIERYECGSPFLRFIRIYTSNHCEIDSEIDTHAYARPS